MNKKKPFTKGDYLPYLLVAPFFILFVIYMAIGQHIENGLTIDKLTTVKGVPKDPKIGYTLGRKRGLRRNKHYYITFNVGEEAYRVRHITNLSPHQIFNKINNAKEIQIWHRSRFQQLMGLGYKYDVYQLKEGKEILLSIEQVKKKHSIFLSMLYPSIFMMLFGLWVLALYKYKTLPE